jgi:hypothetical protein
VTNHDVKAIEYVLKRRLSANTELAKVSAPQKRLMTTVSCNCYLTTLSCHSSDTSTQCRLLV